MKHGIGGRVAVREIACVLQAKSRIEICEISANGKTVIEVPRSAELLGEVLRPEGLSYSRRSEPRRRDLLREGGGIAGATGGEEARDAVVDGRQRGEWSVRIRLVPIGDGEEIIGAVIGVAVLDGGA